VILLVSLAVAVLFAAGTYLMLKRDLIRVITGVIMLGNAANLFIMLAGLRRGVAPVLPSDVLLADALVQAMTLTALVVSFSIATLVLAVVYRVYDSHHSVDVSRLSRAEAAQAELDDAGVPGRGVSEGAGDAEDEAEELHEVPARRVTP
jgi:multicomponent Na+:H+ antiporter subunit C